MKWTFDKLAPLRSIFPAALSGRCNAPRSPARCGMGMTVRLGQAGSLVVRLTAKVKGHRQRLSPQHLTVTPKSRLV